jgi:hypothetical protein
MEMTKGLRRRSVGLLLGAGLAVVISAGVPDPAAAVCGNPAGCSTPWGPSEKNCRFIAQQVSGFQNLGAYDVADSFWNSGAAGGCGQYSFWPSLPPSTGDYDSVPT